MWLTFREKHTEVCALFEQLSKLGFESVSLAHCQTVIQALNLLARASETGLPILGSGYASAENYISLEVENSRLKTFNR